MLLFSGGFLFYFLATTMVQVSQGMLHTGWRTSTSVACVTAVFFVAVKCYNTKQYWEEKNQI